MTHETGRRTLCGDCGAALDEQSDLPVEERRSCPSCGSIARRFELELAGSIELRPSLGLKARHPGERRLFLEHFSGADFSTRLRRWIDKLRRIDLEGDRYDEVVTEVVSRQVVEIRHRHPRSSGDRSE